MNENEKFEKNAKVYLDETLEDLTPEISRRLQQARYAALESVDKPASLWSFYPQAATAILAVAIISLSLFLNVENNVAVDSVIAMDNETEIEMLSSNDSLELMEDLEFIEWLVEFEEYAS